MHHQILFVEDFFCQSICITSHWLWLYQMLFQLSRGYPIHHKELASYPWPDWVSEGCPALGASRPFEACLKDELQCSSPPCSDQKTKLIPLKWCSCICPHNQNWCMLPHEWHLRDHSPPEYCFYLWPGPPGDSFHLWPGPKWMNMILILFSCGGWKTSKI